MKIQKRLLLTKIAKNAGTFQLTLGVGRKALTQRGYKNGPSGKLGTIWIRPTLKKGPFFKDFSKPYFWVVAYECHDIVCQKWCKVMWDGDQV